MLITMFQIALEYCGRQTFLAAIFEEMNEADYYEEVSVWKLKDHGLVSSSYYCGTTRW